MKARPRRSTYGLLDRDRPGAGRVGGMWVAPASRRRGVGRLSCGGVDWAASVELTGLGLWAPARSPGAIALYSREGFERPGPPTAGVGLGAGDRGDGVSAVRRLEAGVSFLVISGRLQDYL